MTRGRNKALQFNWDFINSKDDETSNPVCLTWAERQILLSMVDYIGWKTRWEAETGTVTQEKIFAWQSSITNKLIGGCDMSDSCDYVWACLGIDPIPESLLDWLLEQLGENSDIIDAINNPDLVPSPIVNDVMVSECDKDLVFGFALQLVQFINLAIEDVFELIEASTNSVELAEVVLSKIPGASNVADFVDYLQEAFAEQYLASYTTTLENTYACEIMCMIVNQENCTATWNDLYEYFLQRFGAGLANKNIIDLLNFVGGGGWSGTEFCDAAFAAFCGMLFYGERWSDITLAGVQNFWNSWLNDANEDWETLCGTSCGWALNQQLGSNHTETYWEATCGIELPDAIEIDSCAVGFEGTIINITLPIASKVNRIKTYYRSNNGGNANIGRWTLFDANDEILQNGQWDLVAYTGDDYDTFIKYVDQYEVKRVKFELIADWEAGGSGYVKTNQIDLTGSGTDPFA